MSKFVTAAIVATGNEIVSGQILNTNAQYLADHLSSLGVEVVYHFAVLDRREDLEEVLATLRTKQIDEVFVIGGLGPTSDDLTRYIVADFFEQDFEFNHETWSQIAELLKTRSVALRDSHKRQCYFPVGSKILLNAVGTAQGFRTEKEGMGIWCVPGPPPECRSVFENAIVPWAAENVRAKTDLLTWQCIGVPESDVADKVEEALKDCSYEIGFRASPPIVEVKLRVPTEHMGGVSQMWVDQVEEIVRPHLYSRQGQNYFKESLDFIIGEKEIDLVDEFSKGVVYEELLKNYRGDLPGSINFSTKPFEHNAETMMQIRFDEKSVELAFSSIDQNFVVELDLDLSKAQSNKRYRKTICAKLFKGLHGELFG